MPGSPCQSRQGPIAPRLIPKVKITSVASPIDTMTSRIVRNPGENARVRFASNRALFGKGCHILKYSA